MNLNEVQQKLKAPKGQTNSFGKYKYRSCEDILEALKTLLVGTATITLSDEMICIGDRYYVKATATFKSESEEVSVTAYAREAESKKGMDESQITGAASSYARKYALNGLFAIDDTKDADTQDNSQPEPATQAQVQAIEDYTVRYSIDDEKMKEWLGTTDYSTLTKSKASETLKALKTKYE